MSPALGLLETTGYTPAIVALDEMGKAANVQVLQAELNDFLGVVIKFSGDTASVEQALEVGLAIAGQMGGDPVGQVIANPDERAMPAIRSGPEYNPLIQQDVVHQPLKASIAMNNALALGFIETQGFTAVFDAIDAACKAANVEVVGKEKLGGGFVTVIIRGDVAAVTAAVEAGSENVERLGKLIAAHVIARPSPATLSLLPKV